jgi:methanogenic corrinoid protein MtbC1
MSTTVYMEDIAQAVRNLAPDAAAEAVRAALEDGAQPAEIIDRGMVKGMEAVGEAYQREEVFLPELLMAEQCMRSGLAEIEEFEGEDGAAVVDAAQQRLAQQAASWIPALSSCVTRLLHSSDSFLKT